MKVSDLEAINETRTRNLKICEGLLWHLRLDHASESYLRMAKSLLPELKGVIITDEIKNCIDCRLGKAKRQPFSEERKRATRPFQTIESDIAGMIQPTSFQTKAKYFVTFTDNYSRYALGYELFDKTELHLQFQTFLSDMRELVENESVKIEELVNVNQGQQFTCKVGRLHTDNGTEYKTDEMKDLLRRENIRYDPCNPNHKQHNGIAERLNLDIEEKVRTLLLSSGMPLAFWGYAMKFALHVRNRFINSAIDYKTPYEMITGKQATLKNIRRFGCLASYVHGDPGKSKFAPTGSKGFLVGMTQTGYKIYDPRKGKVIPTKHVTFVESKVYGDFLGANKREELDDLQISSNECDCENLLNENEPIESTSTEEKDLSEDGQTSDAQERNKIGNKNLSTTNSDNCEMTDREQLAARLKANYEPITNRTRGAMKRKSTWDANDILDYEVECEEEEIECDGDECDNEANLMVMYAHVCDEFEPNNYKEATKCKDSELWKESMKEELDAHHKMETWRLIGKSKMPKKASIVTARWVYKVKSEPNIGVRRKSRMVARGFGDLHEYGINETYAPVGRPSDFKCAIAIANKYNYDLEHIDIKTAFLNGKLEKKVYMQIPEGLKEYLGIEEPKFEQTHVLELDKAIYGLKVSPKRWYLRFSEAMKRMRLIKYDFQPCIYYYKNKGKCTIISVYVDDILILTNDREKLHEIKVKLEKEFETKNLGEVKKFLGMEIVRDRKNQTVVVHQKGMITSVIKKFDLYGTLRTSSTPMATTDAERKIIPEKRIKTLFDPKRIPYRNAIGTLSYIANATRPDIMFAVNYLSRRQQNYGEKEWEQVKRIFRYLKGTANLGIKFDGKGDRVECYVDALLGLNEENARSTSGYVVTMFGDPVAWKTQLQRQVALSFAESEYVAMSQACKEIISIQALVTRLGRVTKIPRLYEDNRASIKLAITEESQTLRHLVKLSYHYVRQLSSERRIEIQWISTKQQIGDFFTKALAREQFEKFRNKLMREFDLLQRPTERTMKRKKTAKICANKKIKRSDKSESCDSLRSIARPTKKSFCDYLRYYPSVI